MPFQWPLPHVAYTLAKFDPSGELSIMSRISRVLPILATYFFSSALPSTMGYGEPSAAAPAKERKNNDVSSATVKKGVAPDALFQQAMALFNQGVYAKAALLFRQVLAIDAKYIEAKIGLARSYYRMNRIKESFEAFTELNPKDLDSQSGYEYGLTHFAHKQYTKAMDGFAMVGPNDPFFDLASLYGAISAYRLKRFDKAGELINKAVVLPNHLIKMRSRYKGYIADNLAKTDRPGSKDGAIKLVSAPTLKNRPQAQSQFAVDTSASMIPVPSNVLPPAMPPAGGFAANVAGGYQNKQQASSYGTRSSRSNAYLASASAGGIWNHYFNTAGTSSSFPVLSVLTQLDVENLSFDALDQNPMEDPLTATKNSAIANVRSNGQITSAVFSLMPSFTKPLGEDASFSLALRHTTVIPEFKMGMKAINRSLSLALQNGTPLGQAALYIDAFQSVNNQDSLLKTELREMARYTFNLPDNLQLFVGAMLSQFQYEKEAVDGPNDRYGGFGGIQATFPMNITVGGLLLQQQTAGMRVHGFPNYEAIVFRQATTTANGYLILKIFPWLTTLMSATEQRRILKGIEPSESGANDELTRKYPVYIRNYELSLRAETTF